MELELTREGSFHASQMEDTPFKCGAMRNKSYHYRVKIEALDLKLSPEGFLMNNELVQAYFEVQFGEQAPRKWQAISCENMARKAARDICSVLAHDGIAVTCVTVSIKGSNGAWLSARCKPQDGQDLSWRDLVDNPKDWAV